MSRSTLAATFDTDEFVAACRAAAAETEPHRAVRDLLQRTMAAPDDVADALRPEQGGLTLLHQSDDLTVVHVVWAPGMRIYPHDHQMWAVIGIYGGDFVNEPRSQWGPGPMEERPHDYAVTLEQFAEANRAWAARSS